MNKQIWQTGLSIYNATNENNPKILKFACQFMAEIQDAFNCDYSYHKSYTWTSII